MGIRGSIGGCCYECQEKFEACHDVCEKYIAARAEWEEQKRQIKEARDKYKFFDDYRRDQSRKQRRISENHKRR